MRVLPALALGKLASALRKKRPSKRVMASLPHIPDVSPSPEDGTDGTLKLFFCSLMVHCEIIFKLLKSCFGSLLRDLTLGTFGLAGTMGHGVRLMLVEAGPKSSINGGNFITQLIERPSQSFALGQTDY